MQRERYRLFSLAAVVVASVTWFVVPILASWRHEWRHRLGAAAAPTAPDDPDAPTPHHTSTKGDS